MTLGFPSLGMTFKVLYTSFISTIICGESRTFDIEVESMTLCQLS